MRINNNIMAMNTHRQYGINNASISKSTEKLSSGYRINRAGDDAAGLAISEKMRAQIRGLTMASKNSQDAISLVQTAEGALQETHNILQRMRELAVQSGSDTNEQTIDRGALNKEFQQLKAEIDDIADKTRFNDQNLIDGTFSQYKFSAEFENNAAINFIEMGNATSGTYNLTSIIRTVGAEAGQKPSFFADKGKASNVDTVSFGNLTGLADENTTEFNGKFTLSFEGVDTTAGATNEVAIFKLTAEDGRNFTGTASITSDADTITISFADIGEFTVGLASNTADTAADSVAGIEAAAKGLDGITLTGIGGKAEVEGTKKAYINLGTEEVEVFAGDREVEFRSAGITLVLKDALTQEDLFGAANDNTEVTGFDAGTVTVNQTQGQSLVIQTGANQGDNLSINLDKMNTRTLGINTASIESREKASNAITYVNNAVNIVSDQRAALGALQNRLNHKIANLDTSAENLQAAESRIRDVDMAKEMTTFTRNNILFQASTAMLAQANAAPQGVLQLLG